MSSLTEILRLVAGALPPDEQAALDDPRVHVHYEDGRRYVKRMAGGLRYDVVLVNVPDPHGMLNRFYTVDFTKRSAASWRRTA